MVYLDAVVFASVIPSESSASSSSAAKNTFTFDPKRIKAAAKNTAPSSVDAAAPVGFISQLDLAGSEAFGVKTAPFAFRDCSAPVQCLASLQAQNDFFCAERGRPCLVAYHPQQSALFVYAGGKEKPLTRSFGHERITALCGSPCGGFLVAGMENGSVAAWNAETGDLVALVEGAHFQAVRVVRFSADGQTVATGGADALVKVWRFAPCGWPGFVPVFSFAGHAAPVTDLVFSVAAVGGGCGRLVSSSLDGSVRCADLTDGQCLFEVSLPAPLSCLAMDAAETQLFCAAVDGLIYVVDLCPVEPAAAAAANRTILKSHRGPISALAWSPEERVLISAGFEDGSVAFWDSQTRQLLKTVSVGQRCSVTGLVVMAKADVPNAMLVRDSAALAAASTLAPFKRVGSALAAMDEAAPLRKPLADDFCSRSSVDSDELSQLKRENAQLRQINGELCALLE